MCTSFEKELATIWSKQVLLSLLHQPVHPSPTLPPHELLLHHWYWGPCCDMHSWQSGAPQTLLCWDGCISRSQWANCSKMRTLRQLRTLGWRDSLVRWRRWWGSEQNYANIGFNMTHDHMWAILTPHHSTSPSFRSSRFESKYSVSSLQGSSGQSSSLSSSSNCCIQFDSYPTALSFARSASAWVQVEKEVM